jgi:cysteinyl-tRNA synthetase
MALRVYNTLTRKKEEFRTVRPGKVGMYLCGPTVYKPSHVGHMVGPVIFDTVKRYLTYLGYQVTFVVNITDVDDKIINEAAKQNVDWKQLAERVTADYQNNLKVLGVTGIDHFPRATEHIGDIQRMMQGLIDKGYAYAAGGDVYFEVGKDPDYGKLCNRDPEQLEAGARIEVSDKKRNPGDFALWKGAKPGEPKWDSPWGPGRPGWHIECSAMCQNLLGETLDIHGGGLDLQFPHHENELAQSESYNDKPFVRYWMHNGLMKIGNDKISKTKEEEQKKIAVLGVSEVLQKHQPETLRFLLLSTHYRSPIEYNEDRLVEVRKALDNFYRFFERYQRVTGDSFYALQAPGTHTKAEPVSGEFLVEVNRDREAFLACMDDDFNTGGAIGVLNELLTTLNRFADSRQLESGKANAAALSEFRYGAVVLKELSQILGLFREAPAKPSAGNDELVNGLMQLLIDLRNNLRAEAKKIPGKDDPVKKALFDQTDQIRKRLGELGIILEDRPGGTGWRLGS